MAGLLDPQSQGLLGLALGLLEAGGPQTRPTSFGQAIARGGAAGMGAYQDAIKRQAEGEDRELMKRYREAQMAELMARAQKASRMKAEGIDPEGPSDWQTALLFMNAYNKGNPDKPMTPDQAFLITKRSGQFRGMGGVEYKIDPITGEATPLLSPEAVASNVSTIESARETAKRAAELDYAGPIAAAEAHERAARTPTEIYDPKARRVTRGFLADLPGYPGRPRIPSFAPTPASVPAPQSAGPRQQIAPQDIVAEGQSALAELQAGMRPQGTSPASTGGRSALVPKEQELDAERRKKIDSMESTIENSERVIATIDDAVANTSHMTTGLGALTDILPLTPARTQKGRFTTIAANIGFDRLQQMRFDSPTGGALGQVAIQELVALQSSIAALDRLQRPEDVKKNLSIVKDKYEKGIDKLRRAIAAEKYFLQHGRDIGQDDPLNLRGRP